MTSLDRFRRIRKVDMTRNARPNHKIRDYFCSTTATNATNPTTAIEMWHFSRQRHDFSINHHNC